VDLNHNSGIFITMNPAGKGYGGRQKLPDNLKQLFRPVAMSRPDNDQIAEVILFSEGFKEAKSIGRKLVAIFNLSREMLSPQQHYDWGLRALKTVLRGAGSLLDSEKKDQHQNRVSSEVEVRVVVQVLRLNTLSKLTFADRQRFDALVRDVFTGVEFRDVEYGALEAALRETSRANNLVVIDRQIHKALELYTQLRQRMGVVIVGPSGSGKTTVWNLLKTALVHMGRSVKHTVLNPKAMPRTQLLGHIDIDTREWTDGVLTFSARGVVKEPSSVHSWIVCDGDIDPEWIESLNSVLDDNRLLTMPSGERIQFGPNVNFLFESHDLSCASPATISRMGMIFMSDEDTNIKALVTGWLQSLPPSPSLSSLEGWIEDYFHQALDWVVMSGDLVVNTTVVGVAMNGLSHLVGVASKAEFACALVRGLGGNLPLPTREKFAKEVFHITHEIPPDSRRLLDTYYDHETGKLATYQLELPDNLTLSDLTSSEALPVIRTPDQQRNQDSFRSWLHTNNKHSFIIVGPEGCGKEMLLRHSFSELRSVQVAVIHCSAQTTATHVLQKLAQVCMVISTNTGRVYRPRDCERLILFLKDLNLPKPDKWGTSQLIAFLQQVLTYRGFHDEHLEWVGLEGVQIVGSMNPGSTLGRYPLSSRFTSIVRICSIGYQVNTTDLDYYHTIHALPFSTGIQTTTSFRRCMGRTSTQCSTALSPLTLSGVTLPESTP
jgi:dynein heavy chain 2